MYNLSQMIKLITPDQLANIMQVSKRTIYNLVYQGKLPAVKFGGSLRFNEDGLGEMLKVKGFKGDRRNGKENSNNPVSK